MAKSAVGGAVGEGLNAVIPGAGTITRAGLDAVGLGMGGRDLLAGVRGLIKPSGAGIADALDASVSSAFKPPQAGPQGALPQGLGQPPAGPDPFAAPAGPVDPRVQTTQPPDVWSGDSTGAAAPDPFAAPVGPANASAPQPQVVPPRPQRVPMWKQDAGAAKPAEPAAETPTVKATEQKTTEPTASKEPPSGFPKADATSSNPPRSFATKNAKQMAEYNKNLQMSKVRELTKGLQESLKDNPSAIKKTSPTSTSLDQFEKQYKGRFTETNGTVNPASLLKKIGAEGVIPRDQVAHIEEAWRSGKEVEPVKLYVDEKNNILGADGRHRAQAAVNAGKEQIPILLRRVRSK
jgi:hypothetical protein